MALLVSEAMDHGVFWDTSHLGCRARVPWMSRGCVQMLHRSLDMFSSLTVLGSSCPCDWGQWELGNLE